MEGLALGQPHILDTDVAGESRASSASLIELCHQAAARLSVEWPSSLHGGRHSGLVGNICYRSSTACLFFQTSSMSLR